MTQLSEFDILNSLADSIAIIESNGQIIFTNQAWKNFSLNNSGDLNKTGVGSNYLEVSKNAVGPDQLTALEAYTGISKVINGELNFFEIEYPCHSETERRWFILRATSLAGFKNLFLLIHINITERKLCEEAIHENNKQIKEINSRLNSSIYKIVHDIQGPINSIQGLINLTNRSDDSNEAKTYLSMINQSCRKLKEFIQGTLKMITLKEKAESIDFKIILSDIYESVKYLETAKIVNVKFDVQQNHPHFNIRSEISSILSNLINNSLKYYDPKKNNPMVVVSITTQAQEATISVTDNGIGIREDLISKVFELNFQVEKKGGEGVGLGLHMVTKSLEQLDGRLDIKSKPREGTTITIILPNKTER